MVRSSYGRADEWFAAPKPDESDQVFGLPRIGKVPLHVTAENGKTMQPPAGGGFPGFGPPPGLGGPGGMRPGSFGFDFE